MTFFCVRIEMFTSIDERTSRNVRRDCALLVGVLVVRVLVVMHACARRSVSFLRFCLSLSFDR